MTFKYKRLPLDGASNVRDIGGYLVYNGTTKWGTFLRSEGLEHVTDHDAAFLYEYGIRTVIDLRTRSEFEKNNIEYLINTFASNGITHRNIPFFDDYNDISKHFYIHMIDNGAKNIKQLFEYIGERLAHGGILYNCFMGKDRTGVLSALLLLLVGVSKLDILADYMVSSVYLKPLAERLDLSDEFISSKPEFMDEFLIYFEQHYTNAEQYLFSIGVSQEVISVIKEKFVCRELRCICR
jgi:protein-tyrosine phosphatase